jgi:hypothetical protein
MDLLELDFEQARARHILFKTKLRSVLYGAELDITPVISHVACPVGQWIYDHALKVYGHIPEMQKLEEVHKQLHEQAHQLILKYRAGHVQQAREGLVPLEETATAMIAWLNTVETKAKGTVTEDTLKPMPGQLNINYKELLDLHQALYDLDARIQKETQSALLARQAVEASEVRFRNTMMQAPVGIVILRGRDMMVEMANETYLQIVDREERAFTGRPLFESLPEVEETVSPILQGVLNTGKAFHGYEFEVPLNRFGEKQQAYFNFVYQPYREADGSVTGIIVVASDVTVQVMAKQKLAESEKQFRNMVSQSPIAMGIFMGEDFIIDMANETLLKTLWRRSFDEVYGRKLLDVFPELIDQEFPALLREVYKTGVPFKKNEAQALINTYLGMQKHYLDFEYAPFRGINRSIQGILVTVYDVTEKVETRNKINEAEQSTRLAIEAANMGTFDWDLSENQFFTSKRLIEIFGFKEGENPRHTDMLERFHPEDKPIRDKAVNDSLTKGSLIYEARIIWPDNSIHWVKVHGKIIPDQVQNMKRMYGTVIDVTEQNNAILELRENEAKFRLLADSMPQFIWTGDTSGNLNYFSQAVYHYTGLTQEKLNMFGWIQIVHPDDQEENIRQWTHSVETGEPFLLEHRFRRYDGEFRWQLSRAIPQRDETGKIQRWVGTSTDIHDRKMFINELETTVQNRTRELTETNDALLKSNAELAQFAYVASHDLQEPLRKIQTFASRIIDLEEGNFSPQSLTYFERMQSASGRMQQLIADLLEFSHINTVTKEFIPTDLNRTVQVVQEQLSERIEQQHATVIVNELPVLPVIPFQFEQLMANMIGNALKYARPDVPPVITLSAAVVSGSDIIQAGVNGAQHYHLITVEDNGIGFEPEFSERIFQVFQRLHNREAYEGTGIGLAICKKIVENHQGIITATGRPGQGAAFFIYIPIKEIS